jgi:serine/threonine-protein kinase ULK/ATG1
LNENKEDPTLLVGWIWLLLEEDMDLGGPKYHPRLAGNYILGPRIGSGSFAVVWRSRHRDSGAVVAVKEINMKQLSPKVSENLLKEIDILRTINNPNIIRLFDVIKV